MTLYPSSTPDECVIPPSWRKQWPDYTKKPPKIQRSYADDLDQIPFNYTRLINA